MQPPRTLPAEQSIPRSAPPGPARSQQDAGNRFLDLVPEMLREPLCDYLRLRGRDLGVPFELVLDLRRRLFEAATLDELPQDRREAARTLALALLTHEHEALLLANACTRDVG